jgi:cytochrome c oxidase subunit 2
MPHFRAQMNCVPGMVTQFAFTPTVTTAEMRLNPEIAAKVENINKIRTKRSEQLVDKGETALDPYTFDYLLLCNKICGASHYNMQMKIVVESADEFKDWLKDKPTFSEVIKSESESSNDVSKADAKDSSLVKKDSVVVKSDSIKVEIKK